MICFQESEFISPKNLPHLPNIIIPMKRFARGTETGSLPFAGVNGAVYLKASHFVLISILKAFFSFFWLTCCHLPVACLHCKFKDRIFLLL